MANEVIITTYKAASNEDGISSGVFGAPVGGEVVDIGTRSAQLTGEIARITAKGAGFWYRIGDNAVNAAADTDGNGYLADGASIDIEVTGDGNYVDTAA